MPERTRLSARTHLALALRNLERNRRRTALTLFSLVLATGVVTFLGAMNDGWLEEMQTNFVLTLTGHVQIHAPGHQASWQTRDHLPDLTTLAGVLDADPAVQAWTPAVATTGLASVATASAGVHILGRAPEAARSVCRLHRLLVEGRCLQSGDDRDLVLGHTVATTLNVRPGDQVVLMGQTPGGEIVSELFTLRGILRSGAPQIDRMLAIVPLATAQGWLGLGSGATHVTLRARDGHGLEALVERLRQHLPAAQYEVLPWWRIDRTVWQWLRFGEAYGLVILGIVVALTIAQVGNTMVMALHERVREFGLMEALGTRRGQIFAMVGTEALILVAAGGLLGYSLGVLGVALTAGGIDFSAFSGAFEFFFMDPVVRPRLSPGMGLKIAAALALAALVGGLYPAWRAARLDPIEALRHG